MKKTFEFNKIYVIESLREKDLKTGQKLYNDTIKVKLMQKSLNNNCKLFLPKSKIDFFNVIEEIKAEATANEIYPLIHLEMHGSKDGIQVTNYDIINWTELQHRLIELNMLCKCNLFLTVATCYGGYIYSTISPRFRTPFWGFIGPFETVTAGDVLYNFTAFYDEFIPSLDINKSVELLNKSNSDNKSKFKFHNTEYAFEVSYKNYEEKYLIDEMVEKRLEDGLVEARKDPENNNRTDNEIKEGIKFWMVDNKDFMKSKLMEKFFMLDLFPERNRG